MVWCEAEGVAAAAVVAVLEAALHSTAQHSTLCIMFCRSAQWVGCQLEVVMRQGKSASWHGLLR